MNRNPLMLGSACLLGSLACACAAPWADAQAPYYYYPPVVPVPVPVVYTPAPPVMASVPFAAPRLDEAQLDQINAGIALDPDPLLAVMLPAATYPLELVTAAQWLRTNPQPTEDLIAAQPWEPPIKALVHYPAVLQMMSDRLDWTQALGAAFVNQPSAVLASIQRLRAQAQASGALVSTPQQDVLVVDGEIRIVPVSPEVIFVPVYDPQVVYVRRAVVRPVITFGVGLRIGGWLDFDCDWGHGWVSSNVRWDRGWGDRDWAVRVPPERRRPVVIRPPVVVEHPGERPGERPGEHPGPVRRPVVIEEAPRPWVRNPVQPAPVLPPALHHAPGAAPAPAPAPPEPRGYAPPPPAHPAPPAFHVDQPRAEAEHAGARGRESRPELAPPARAPEPQHQAAPVFHDAQPGGEAADQSRRGHDSMRH